MTWTTPGTPVTATAITVSFYSTNIRDNLSHLRGMLPDSSTANRALISTGALAATWQQIPDAAMANTPVHLAGDTMTGQLIVQKNTGAIVGAAYSTAGLQIKTTNSDLPAIGFYSVGLATAIALYTDTNDFFGIDETGNAFKLWSQANDGAGSGLDADTVDGSQASALLARANHTGTQAPATISPQGTGSGLDADTVDGIHAASFWQASNDGAGSGLDADLLDGLQAAAFGLKYATGTYVGDGTTAGRQVTTGFIPTFGIIVGGTSNATMEQFLIYGSGHAVRTVNNATAANVATFSGSVGFHGSNGFTVAGGNTHANISGVTYTWLAFTG